MEVIKVKPEFLGAVNVGKDFSVFEEGFAWDTPPVKTHATQGVAFDNSGLESQLSGADGRNVPPRPSTYYHHIII